MDILAWILTFAITAGQLIRIPVGQGGITILDLSVILFCLLGVIKLKFKFRKPPVQIITALVFIFIASASLLLTPLHLKLNEYLISFSYTVRFFLYLLFAWLIYSGAFGGLQKKLERIILLSGISLAILGLLQIIFFPDLFFLPLLGWDPHYFRDVSTFLDPNFIGAFFVLTLLLSFQDFKKDKKLGILFFILIYIALLFTFSRSSYLMLLISGITLSYLKQSKIIFLVTILLFSGLMLGFILYSRSVAEPRGINRTESASYRFDTWQQGLTLFQKSPVLGLGYNAYRFGLEQYQLGDRNFLASHGSSSNDSSLLSVASTTGIIGFIAYCYFLLTLLKLQKKNAILVSGLTGLIIHSFFANSLFYPPILLWILLISIGKNSFIS